MLFSGRFITDPMAGINVSKFIIWITIINFGINSIPILLELKIFIKKGYTKLITTCKKNQENKIKEQKNNPKNTNAH